MRQFLVVNSLFLFLVIHGAHAQSLQGFTDAHASAERALESRFDSIPRPENMRAWMKFIASHPHHIGSPHGKAVAEFIASKFRSWGFDTAIETFYVLFPTPKIRLLEMTSPSTFKASLAEQAVAEDSTSALQSEQLPLFNAYSIDGDVTGQLVYVNYGIPKDYDELEQRGVDVKGKIVIARYGGSWRGIKPKIAAEHGAVGCIIYSDPREDGYFEGDVYPKGPFRNETGGQRGSVLDMPLYPGDPLTPSIPATKGARRLTIGETKTLTRIPVLPISYSDALPLFRSLSGPVAPAAWRGALPVTYHCGPGPATVHLSVTFSWDIVPINDVIATLRGREYPDEWVIRGNHHDAWVCGAFDPVSGLVSMMEEARGVGEMAQQGWKPQRTIVYCAWDGEEEGLLGSTEWVEAHADDLRQKAVAYINSDSNGRGFLNVAGSHTLEKFVSQVAQDVTDPEYGISAYQRLRAVSLANAAQADLKEQRNLSDLRIGALGSGSDYTPFIQHLGIASLNLGYGGEDEGGSYHSIFDSYDFYTRFVDPTFTYGVTSARTNARVTLRLANADVLPFEFSHFSETVGRYARELMKLTESMREETEELNRQIRENTLLWASDPKEKRVLPQPKEPVPYLSFSPLQNSLAALQHAATEVSEHMLVAGSSLRTEKALALNRLLRHFEHSLTRSDGLPGRPWYVHQIYAPGMYTGYGVKTLPSVREAIEVRQWQIANEQIRIVAGVFDAATTELHKICSLLKKE